MPQAESPSSQVNQLLDNLKMCQIVGGKLMAVARWVEFSTQEGADPAIPRLLLPPIQRSAAWRPSQVLAFWDSLLRGLPVGTFYLMRQSGGHQKGRAADGIAPDNIVARDGDYFLLDGQQRLRALLAGLLEKNADNRCLWIDLTRLQEATDPGATAPCLFLTSEAQPFGYDPRTGRKLGAADRREARDHFRGKDEHHQLWRKEHEGYPKRAAYNQDLFSHPIELWFKEEKLRTLATPPRPFKASPATAPLWRLLQGWEVFAHDDHGTKVERLRDMLMGWNSSPDPDINTEIMRQAEALAPESLNRLVAMFNRYHAAQVALVSVEVGSQTGQVSDQDLPLLFTRIGAGGTPLSQEERLYSIYKHYVPEVHALVEQIHKDVGRVLPPTGIAMTALRIANVERQGRNVERAQLGTPDEKTFREAMQTTPRSEGGSDLRQEVDRLLPNNRPSKLMSAFGFLRDAVAGELNADHSGIGNPECAFWIPDVLLASLSQNLWQVVAYWAVKNEEARCAKQSRAELVRFMLFWHLCVQHDDNAGYRAFDSIRQQSTAQSCFPGQTLYEALTDKAHGNPVALELVSPNSLCEILRIEKPEPGLWPSWTERFEQPERSSDIDKRKAEQLAARWWPRRGGGECLLPWLQRQYISDNFGDYAPLSNQEDDLPYDIDHICAASRFNAYWNASAFWGSTPDDKLDKQTLGRLRENRDLLGNSIGNLQILGMSKNRSAQDVHHLQKEASYPASMENLWWRNAEPENGQGSWGQEQRVGFQSAVEQRAVYLYRRFFEDLAFHKWGISTNPDVRQ